MYGDGFQRPGRILQAVSFTLDRGAKSCRRLVTGVERQKRAFRRVPSNAKSSYKVNDANGASPTWSNATTNDGLSEHAQHNRRRVTAGAIHVEFAHWGIDSS